jgi:hypothetical protein
MKSLKLLIITLALFASLSFTASRSSKSKTTTNRFSTTWVRPLIKTAKSYASFANLAYCENDTINALACPLCDTILDGSFKVLHTQEKIYKGKLYRFVILSSDAHKELVISFSGPRSSDAAYFSKIYQNGWSTFLGFNIEKTYVDIYENVFEKNLSNAIETLYAKDSDLSAYKVITVGHSIGGSLAVLAAFELVKSKTIEVNSETHSPIAYTYGQLRIGDDAFVQEVNSMFKVVRIAKKGDIMPRISNCVYNEGTGMWRCYKNTQRLMVRFPEYRRYILNYSNKYGQTAGIANAYASRTFLEKRAKVTMKKKTATKAKKGVVYTAANPGYKSYGYSTNMSINSNTFNNVYYSQPMGAEVLYSKRFKSFQVCNYFKGIQNCERTLPRKLRNSGTGDYYGYNIEDC